MKVRKKYHHGDLRSALLAAAWAVVSREGVERLSLRSVAEAVGVSHAGPAHHFADKEALIEALRTEAFRRFGDALEPASRGQEPLRETGRAYLAFARAHPRQLRLMFLGGPREQSTETKKQSERAWKSLEQAVATHLGSQRASDPVDLASTVISAWAAVHGLATLMTQRAFPSGSPPDDVLEARLLDIVGAGALRVPPSPTVFIPASGAV